MSWISARPWWVRLAATGGFGLIGMFAGVVDPDWQWLGLIAGGVLVAIACLGLLLHFWRWPSQFISTTEAGRWLYAKAPERLRMRMRGAPWSSIEEAGRSYVIHATGKDKACHLYGRREPGLPNEEIDPDDADFSTFESVFGSDRSLALETFIRRRDLKRVRAYYQDLD